MPRKRRRLYFGPPREEKESYLDILGNHLFAILFPIVFICSMLLLLLPVIMLTFSRGWLFAVALAIAVITSPMTISALKN